MTATDNFSKTCPECAERLSLDARQCACGWRVGGKRGANSGPEWNHVCTWHFGSLSCRYPVGRFDQGMRSGLCVFHRTNDRGAIAAQIAEDSQHHTPEQYLAAARRFVYGNRPPTKAAAKAGDLRNLESALPVRQPGDDEEEAA